MSNPRRPAPRSSAAPMIATRFGGMGQAYGAPWSSRIYVGIDFVRAATRFVGRRTLFLRLLGLLFRQGALAGCRRLLVRLTAEVPVAPGRNLGLKSTGSRRRRDTRRRTGSKPHR